MENRKIIDKVVAGLCKMDIKPDYFLFLPFYEDEWIWDEDEILQIPVIHTDEWLIRNDDKDCPFYPCWKHKGEYSEQVTYFRNAYSEY